MAAATTGAVRARWLRAARSSSAVAVQPAVGRLAAPPAAASRPRRAAALRRLQAGRGGVADRDSFSDEEDYFGERGSIDYEDEEMELLDDGAMRIYLDSADMREIERWTDTGLFYGVTTNPTILKRDGVQCNIPSLRQLTREVFDLGASELQLQAWGTTAQDMYDCGLDLCDIDNAIVVKLPLTLEGAKAARRLVDDGVPVTMTGVYTTHQVVSALALGAAYAAPYLGRMTDAGKNGLEEVGKMQRIVDMSTELDPMRLLVASIRDAEEIAKLAAEGCNTFTISPAVARQLFDVRLTNEAARTFQEHADAMGAQRGH